VRRLVFNGEFDKHVSNAQQNDFHVPLFDVCFAMVFINQGWDPLPFPTKGVGWS
jgi:hypothetical protein